MNEKHYGVAWLIAHIILGVFATLFPVVLTGWLACVIGGAVLYSLRDKNKAGLLHIAASYLCSYEILARMTASTSEIPMPWETGRYLGIPLLVLGIAMGRKLSTLVPGLILLVLIIPSLIRTDFSRDIRDTLLFNWSGVLILALSVMYFHRRVLMENNVIWILRAIAGPVVTVAVFTTIGAPDLDSIQFTLSANRETTGFGSNQVATVLGMGIVALSVGFFMGRPLFGLPTVDFVVTVYLFFRALISFSRGGLISAVIAAAGALVIVLWAYYKHQNLGQTTRIRRLLLIPLIVPVLGAIFLVTDQLTGGMLSLRYKGETGGTLSGDREMTLTVLTSGRSEIVRTDLQMWYDHLFLGVGAGNSARMRPAYGYRVIAPHTEYTRLVSEHGLLGFAFAIGIVLMPLVIVLNPRYPVVGRALLAAFALFSLTVMAHSATRLFGTTYLYGIGWAIVIPKDVLLRLAVRHPVLRKRLTAMLGRGRPASAATIHGAKVS
ncbi:MAG: O-antigen ligase [Verrucomicrobiales bacterium]|jgi:O-antigen ligase